MHFQTSGKWLRIALYVAAVIGLIIILFCSPFTPIHADTQPPAWNGNQVSYHTGDLVTYNGNIYMCLQSHVSEPNWDPIDTPALWQLQSSSSTPPGNTPTASITPPTGPSPTATNTPSGNGTMTPVSVTIYTDNGLMADGNPTHVGACAAYIPQYPFGTEIQLYASNNLSQPMFSCTVEDTGVHICQNDIDVADPGQVDYAIQFGVQEMELEVVGFEQTIADQAAANHPSSQGCEGGPTH